MSKLSLVPKEVFDECVAMAKQQTFKQQTRKQLELYKKLFKKGKIKYTGAIILSTFGTGKTHLTLQQVLNKPKEKECFVFR